MTIAVDVDLLRQHRLTLLAEADEIERLARPDPPDAGELTVVTREAIEALGDRSERLAGHLRELGDGIDRWLVAARATDGEVGYGLDLLTAQVLAL